MPAPHYARRLQRIEAHLERSAFAEIDPVRLQVLSVAIAMFARRGFAGTSMRDLGAAVGVRAASLYARFPGGKKQLLSEALHAVFDEFLTLVVQPVRNDQGPREQLRTVLTQHVAWQMSAGDKAPAWDAAINQFGIAGAMTADEERDLRRPQGLYHGYVEDLFLETCPHPVDEREMRWRARSILAVCDATPRLSLTSRQTPPAVTAAVWRLTEDLAGLTEEDDS